MSVLASLVLATQMAPLLSALPVTVSNPGAELIVADFVTGHASALDSWSTTNDPVMGGRSTSDFTVVTNDSQAIWEGHVRIVPFLHAAGFCTCKATGLPNSGDYSAYTHVVMDVSTVASATNLTEFQAQFQSSVRQSEEGGGFIANFKLNAGDTQVVIPFAEFFEEFRGTKIGGAPSKAQLAKIVDIGIGADGTAGIFKIIVKSIKVTDGAPAPPSPPPAPSMSIPLVTFEKGGKLTFDWHVVNDPVMGGLSRSTFVVANGVGVFDGTVRIVPSLKAPGFCNAEAISPTFGAGMPDASAALAGGIQLKLTNSGNMTAFKMAWGTKGEYDFGSYKADFTVASTSSASVVYIPFTSFSNKWSASTGEPTTKCSDDKKVCPTADSLKHIGSIGIWGEGVAGSFHLEISEINAVVPSAL